MKNFAFFLAFCMLLAWLIALTTGIFVVGSSVHLLLLFAIVLFAFSFTRDRRSVV